MSDDNSVLEAKLLEVFGRIHEPTEKDFADRQHEFAFHMLDARNDLAAFANLASNPNGHTAEEAQRIVQALLYHAAGHLVAAARLYDVFIDTFARTAPTTKQ